MAARHELAERAPERRARHAGVVLERGHREEDRAAPRIGAIAEQDQQQLFVGRQALPQRVREGVQAHPRVSASDAAT